MDQFCATANDAYRRCVCSSKLSEIQSRERALSRASDQLQDFNDLNINVINKTAQEVNAMLSATDGESAQENTIDTSDSAKQLSGISAVLSKTKKHSLSTQGTLDIAGDINTIWSTTTLTGGSTIANLTGEPLYNAVHAQCSEMVMERCGQQSTLDMIVSAYGMYIENDCSAIINSLDKKLTAANETIRDTERKMNEARLENYNAHNSKSINDCIAQVRIDITSDSACGTNYVHCLDVTGRYLNYNTGEPIYTPDFYRLSSQISLYGDVLTNETNRLIVANLNNKREYAKRGLDTCRDLADEVWDEFMRQAITEIYQEQHERIRQVKNECLEVVNVCYDEQSQSLKDFSNVDEQLLLGARLELSEQLCKEKLDTCSNLYGDGSNGMQELLTAMHNITDAKIAKQCVETLQKYAQDLCAVPGNDTLHAYPYGCRTYVPSERQYAALQICNVSTVFNNTEADTGTEADTKADTKADTGASALILSNTNQQQVEDIINSLKSYRDGSWATNNTYYTSCNIEYIYCNQGYYMKDNKCLSCPTTCTCNGGEEAPICQTIEEKQNQCGDYEGSLYQKMVRYASQACVRPSEASNPLPDTILQDINTVMTQLRTNMATQLATECERWDGEWVSTVWKDDEIDGKHDTTGHTLNPHFYRETNASTDWGFCAEAEEAEEAISLYTIEFVNNNTSTCSKATNTQSILTTYAGTLPTIVPPTCNTPNENYTSCTFAGYYDTNKIQYYYANGTAIRPWDKEQADNLNAYWTCETKTGEE